MNDKRIFRNVFGKIPARREVENNVLSRIFADPIRQFDRADVVALPVVRATLADKHTVAVAEFVECVRTVRQREKVALIAREQHRKRRQRNVFRHDLVHKSERLRVRHDQPRFFRQGSNQRFKLRFLCDKAHRVAVQHVAYRLLLRQYHSAFRRGFVDRRDKHDDIVLLKQVSYQPLFLFAVGGNSAEHFFQFENVRSACRADIKRVLSRCRNGGEQVSLVIYRYERDFSLRYQFFQFFVRLCFALFCIYHKHGDVGLVKRFHRPFDPLFSERALVVRSRGVDDDHRSYRQQFHRLAHGVGRRSLDVGNKRKFLRRNGIYNARFARVPKPEKAYVNSFGGRG